MPCMNTVNCSELLAKFAPSFDGVILPYRIFENGADREYVFSLEQFFKDLFYENDVCANDECFWWWYNKSESVTGIGELSIRNSQLRQLLQPMNDYLKANNINTVINDCIKYIEGEDDDRYRNPYETA